MRRVNANFLKRIISGNRKNGVVGGILALKDEGKNSPAYLALCAAAVLSVTLSFSGVQTSCDNRVDGTGVSFETGHDLTNWSATHSCQPMRVYEPKSAQEVCRVLESHHKNKTKIRPIGTGLSPNGIGMANTDLISLSAMDYVEVDSGRRLVTVGAGARVADILKELAKYDLTLENFSSIQEQQIAGWTQVAAHGTGCTLPTGKLIVQ